MTVADTRTERLNGMERVVARRMLESTSSIPAFASTISVDMTNVAAHRSTLKAQGERPPSINDYVITATADALVAVPRVNSSLDGDHRVLHRDANIGMAVATDAGGLVVPVLRAAQTLTLTEIAAETRRLADIARTGRLRPTDVADGTFTVSNLGMEGVESFIPIINMPQAAILGVGCLTHQVELVDGELVNTPRLRLTVNCDHRLIYGHDAARFLSAMRLSLERSRTDVH